MPSFLVSVASLLVGASALEAADYSRLKQSAYELMRQNQTELVSNSSFNAPGRGMPFDCKDLGASPSVPTSVHALRPGDIRVVGAIGDSITAGFGEASTSIFNLLTEWRGRSWCIGAEFPVSRLATVPNILQEFTERKIVGGAVGNGGANSANARFNKANSGAIAADMPSQARTLVQAMKEDPSVDFENDWKVVTLWIGGNDLCAVCNNRNNPKYSPEGYTAFLEEALDIFQKDMPRTFVNLVSILEITQLKDVQSPLCIAGLLCSCGTTDNADDKAYTKQIASEYMTLTKALADKAKYNVKDDFTVVNQPFWTETDIPRKADGSADSAYFAPDCFHFSELGHEGAAVALWNNMIEPVGQKATSWVLGEQLKCPSSARPFLATAKN